MKQPSTSPGPATGPRRAPKWTACSTASWPGCRSPDDAAPGMSERTGEAILERRQGRCFGEGDPLYERYHDEEWGFPVLDEGGLFERIILEAFQSGLSWRTILARREGFRAAFAGFRPDVVARYGDRDVARLLGDAHIIRNRAKIEATIANARATVALRSAGGSLAAIVRAHAPAPSRPAPSAWDEVPASTPESVALARELKRLGFRFVGPTT